MAHDPEIPRHAVQRFRERFPHLRRLSDAGVRAEILRIYLAAKPEPTRVSWRDIRRGTLPGGTELAMLTAPNRFNEGGRVVLTVLPGDLVFPESDPTP